MRLARCEKGHYYDKDKFSACPHCTGTQVAPSETVAYEDPNAKKEEPPAPKPAAPKVEVEERAPFVADVSYSTEDLAKTSEEKLYTEELKPMTDESKPFAQDEKLFTEEVDQMSGGEDLDDMKTVMLDETEVFGSVPVREEPVEETIVKENAEESTTEPIV
jgi:hypothetical protein